MSRAHCPYCGATDGGRCVPAGNGRFTTECRACGRVTEERLTEVEELFVERAREAPLCIVTPDFTEEKYRAPALEEDPYERIGFITAFSTWSLDLAPLYAVTSSSFSGQLAELERVLSDFLYTPGGGGPGGGTCAPTPAGVSVNMVEALRAYYQIVDVTSVLGLEKDSSDHAVQLFRDCSSTTYLRNRNIEALATAALVQASREAQEPRTLQEISAAANIPQKEIGRHMKVLSDALKLSQPVNSNSISVHMPRFCGILQLTRPAQELATHIGEVVINKSFCTRRNPISISAAAIYLACQLEDKRKTQTEICKATGLTEVTLRKVYKELMENLEDLLPPGYTPAVPPEKAFPVSAAALGRVCAIRAAANALGEHSASTSTYSSGANLMSNATSGLGGTECNVGGSMALLSHPANHVRSASMATAGNMSGAGAGVVRVCGPSAMERNPMHLFAMPVSASVPGNAGGGADSLDQPRLTDAVVKELAEREKERAESEHAHAFGGLKIMPPGKLNLSTAAPSGALPFRPPFNHYASIDPRILEMFPVPGPYGLVGMRPEDATLGRSFVDKGRDDNAAHIGVASKGAPQFLNLLPSMGDQGNICALPQGVQLKLAQVINARSLEAPGRERDQQQIMSFDRDTVMLDCNVDRESKRERSDAAASSNTAAALAAAVRASAPPNFHGGFWPAHNPSFGDFGSRVHGAQSIHQGMDKQIAAPTVGDRVGQASGNQVSQSVPNGYPVSHMGSEAFKQSSSVGTDKVILAEASVPAGHPSSQTIVNIPAASEPSSQQKVVPSVSPPGVRGEEVVDGVGGPSKGDGGIGLQSNVREEESSSCPAEFSVTNPLDTSSMASKEANAVACTNSRDMVDGATSVTVSTEPLPLSTDSMVSGEAETVTTLTPASEEKGGHSVDQNPATVADVPGFQSKPESDSCPPASTSVNGDNLEEREGDLVYVVLRICGGSKVEAKR